MKRLYLLPVFLLCCLHLLGQSDADTSFRADTLSDALFARMAGKSYPLEGSSVGRGDLRVLHVLHCDAKGRVCQGELECNKAIAADLLDILRRLYEARYPIERMTLIDDYDADDERSMTANNTSCFCYRPVEGSNRLSKHAMGMAIDINPLYNPCVRRGKDGKTLVQPKAGKKWADRSKPSSYKVVRGDLCYRLFKEHGFRWGGEWNSLKDYQHFEK